MLRLYIPLFTLESFHKIKLKSGVEKILVTGAGGFIGHHLGRYLKTKGYWVRGVDLVTPNFSSVNEFDEFKILDLTDQQNCMKAVQGVSRVYNLAAVNGSVEIIMTNKADLVHDNSLINLNMAQACVNSKVKRVFFSSSACLYPINLQKTDKTHLLKEEDAYPANPDSEYGWEKLMAERIWKDYEDDYGLQVRIGRYFNIYGPEDFTNTLRSKAPMSLTRKVIEAGNGGEVEIWGDGNQKRSFCYIDDCVEATYKMMESNIKLPVNIGTKYLMSINELVDLISDIEGVKIIKVHQLNKAQGVRTRHSDLGRAKKLLKWEARVKPQEGLLELNKFVHGILES